MPLIPEDGLLVENANTYVSVDDFRGYATARDVELPAADPDVEVILIKAVDFLESYADRFKGVRVSRDQALSWPRDGVVIENWRWSKTEIPRQVISAQLALAVEIAQGEDPFNPPAAELPVVRERVEGAVDVSYANPSRVNKVHKHSRSSVIIRQLIENHGMTLVRR